MSDALDKEITQDEAYQKSGHPILEVSPIVKGLMKDTYLYQLRVAQPRITSKEIYKGGDAN